MGASDRDAPYPPGMSSTTANALLSLAGGGVLAVLLLIPVAAYQYRRDGRFTLGDLSVMVGALVYGLALWAYTMLPLPADDFACAGRQLTLGATLQEIRPVRGDAWSTLLRDPAFLQVALNFVLFLPLGYYVRRVLRRGFIVATLAGFGVSLMIEVTQGSGLWFLYDCAYRVFDVDDLLINTLGATAGSVLAVVLVRRRADAERPLPSRLTLGRRWMGMLCDGVFVVLLGSSAALVYRLVMLHPVGDEPDPTVQLALQWGLPALVETILVLAAGRTVGEWVVAIRTQRRRLPLMVARPLKLLAGVGPLLALGPVSSWWASPVLLGFLLLTLLAPLCTRDRRGLSHLVADLDLHPSR